MTYAGLALLVFLFGALGRRIAGGGLNQWAGLPGGVDGRVMGDTPARFIYAGLIAACALPGVVMGTASWLVLPTLTIAVWVGSTTGNFDSIGMGRGGHSFRRDFLFMSLHGTICAVIVLLALAGMRWYASLPSWWYWAGAGFYYAGPAYELGWIITGRTGNPRLPVGLRMGSDLGEAIWGGLCGVGVFTIFWFV